MKTNINNTRENMNARNNEQVNNQTVLGTEPCFNPFIAENIGEVESLNFYKDGKVLAAVRWFGSNNKYRQIVLPFTFKKAVKENLSRSDAFYLKDNEYNYGRRYKLYIPADFVNLQYLGTFDDVATWYQTGTRKDYTAEITGDRWEYYKDEFGQMKRRAVHGTYTEKFSANYIFNETPEFIECKKIAAEWEELTSSKISAFDVHHIRKAYNISKKRTPKK